PATFERIKEVADGPQLRLVGGDAVGALVRGEPLANLSADAAEAVLVRVLVRGGCGDFGHPLRLNDGRSGRASPPDAQKPPLPEGRGGSALPGHSHRQK